MMIQRLDLETVQLWRRHSATVTHPEFENFNMFLQNRIYELNSLTQTKEHRLSSSKPTVTGTKSKGVHAASVVTCILCKNPHYVYSCSDFKKFTIQQRQDFAKRNGLCFNCLKGRHFTRECRCQTTCITCNKRHHTLLHMDPPTKRVEINLNQAQATSMAAVIVKTMGIVPTAIVLIKDGNNSYQPCRALLDTGSTISLISESCAKRLQLKRDNARINISGIGGNNSNGSTTRGRLSLNIKSRLDSFNFDTMAFVLSSLSHELPSYTMTHKSLTFFKNLPELADPKFFVSGRVDIILGADIVFKVLLKEEITNEDTMLSARKTRLGWIVAGTIQNLNDATCCHATFNLDETLKRFWETEEIQHPVQQSEADQQCEDHFKATHSRQHDGRYVVRIPKKREPMIFGNTRQVALQRLHHMEKRFLTDSALADYYKTFMNEYENLHHMESIGPVSSDENYGEQFYLPHHGIWRHCSQSTKLRVVFDGSCKSSNGIALNDLLHVGPKLQANICDILLRFRKGQFGFTSDIIKMFRQIMVHPEDRRFQKILWRDSAGTLVREYHLTTVTYGTSSAPYLSLRVLQQLALDEGHVYPKGCSLLVDNFYVDDLMGSTDSLEDAMQAREELVELLKKGHFNLHKWSSNSAEFLKNIPMNLRANEKLFELDDPTIVKTLGLNWDPQNDVFSFKVIVSNYATTKRAVLSTISRIFDPLGLLAPWTITLKIMMQEIWISGVDWDADLPPELQNKWNLFLEQLPQLSNIKIPRWTGSQLGNEVQLHCFCDASEKAYAAVIYLKCIRKNEVTSRLLIAKSKVAPIKQISLPRLELNGAYLLSRLLLQVKGALSMMSLPIFAWTDSTIVLAWLGDYPRRWSSYIGNRTSFILDVIPFKSWRHIDSSLNPADLATRGLMPNEVNIISAWSNGPEFLHSSEKQFDGPQKSYHTTMEKRKPKAVSFVITVSDFMESLLIRYSSYIHLLRTMAWIKRFIIKCQQKLSVKSEKMKDKTSTVKENLTAAEINDALHCLVRYTQSITFPTDIKSLEMSQPLTGKSKIKDLDPFLDSNGLLRVGGRLRHSNLTWNNQHPLILHKNNVLSKLIVRYYHFRMYHAKGKLLENAIREQFWILKCGFLIWDLGKKCIICQRYKAQPCTQKMGDLPANRVVESGKAFLNSGVDYAGPFNLRTWKGRGAKRQKCYIALFICMATKALHLELVMDLSSEAFIAAFRRFMARRGRVQQLLSDNGTNFQGAFRHLKELQRYFEQNQQNEPIYRFFADNNITWKFIPPYSPHFGGLWEAGVRSVKSHLKHVLAESHLTIEEMTTVLCEVEGFLNSRPLTALSDNIQELDVLTPTHFLTGHAPVHLPHIPIDDNAKYFASRWKYLQSLTTQLWKKWQRDYLMTLQKRTKWLQQRRNLQEGDLVLVIDNNLPPAKWLMGRIMTTLSGPDQLIRVAEIKTKLGIIKRPIHKLCILFYDSENVEN